MAPYAGTLACLNAIYVFYPFGTSDKTNRRNNGRFEYRPKEAARAPGARDDSFTVLFLLTMRGIVRQMRGMILFGAVVPSHLTL